MHCSRRNFFLVLKMVQGFGGILKSIKTVKFNVLIRLAVDDRQSLPVM